MSVFFDSSNEVNIIHSTFIKKLSLIVQSTNVGIQKIDYIVFETYEIIVAVFSVIDQANKVKFFEKIFLMANISSDIVFEMFFLTINDANINFLKRKL